MPNILRVVVSVVCCNDGVCLDVDWYRGHEMIAQLVVWIVVIIGPDGFIPLHHFAPVMWATEAKCQAEAKQAVDNGEFTVVDQHYHLECLAIPYLSGEPA